MKLAIIADDLTGANDSGVQLAKFGLKTSVLFGLDKKAVHDSEAVVFDTDSRSIDKNEAYHKVFEVMQFLKEQGVKNIYKKIDSTLRGNLGSEIDAVYETIKPDFVFIVPGYPKNGRTVINGHHYLNGILLNETEIANDPKTPVTESHIPTLLMQQTNRTVGLIEKDVLRNGKVSILQQVEEFAKKGISYIVVDSETEEDLEMILRYTKEVNFTITWVGSAGLANYLPAYYEIEKTESQLSIPSHNKPILTVVGSVNKNSRHQLSVVLKKDGVTGIKVESYKAVSCEEERTAEITNVVKSARSAVKNGHDVVIYTTGETKDIEKARKTGKENGFNYTETSNEIVKMMGEICAALIEDKLFKGIVMTGGDTAKQVCEIWGVKGFYLHDELEIGVPISTFIGIEDIFVITKAGGFGKETVFVHAIDKLKGVL
ncbi:four-carbon acid sugar kinase family protein [Neobacillus sp. DY30]|uniref:four-carbon acid sugar kinase family protein n=1 Tax=Neobacillus sp. DY30 TaxID=3047871 RepID=UPI0024BF5BF0|nr:four-carbon acid sugar kinase family protein [Neobacillus sp. DY30]WHY02630.1 four-carbon acid sugar kinase family protein [Neobacillus sp. DY30]